MGICHDGWLAKHIAHDEVCALAAHAGQSQQLFKSGGDLTIVFVPQHPHTGGDIPRFGVPKAAGFHNGFDVLRFCGSQCGYTGVLGEQVLDHDIHAGIRTLRGQPDTDKQLPCMGVVQGAPGIRILFFQTVNDLQCQSLPGGKILRHFLANRHCSTSFDKKLR